MILLTKVNARTDVLYYNCTDRAVRVPTVSDYSARLGDDDPESFAVGPGKTNSVIEPGGQRKITDVEFWEWDAIVNVKLVLSWPDGHHPPLSHIYPLNECQWNGRLKEANLPEIGPCKIVPNSSTWSAAWKG